MGRGRASLLSLGRGTQAVVGRGFYSNSSINVAERMDGQGDAWPGLGI